jgi:uncharacterized caspase-like protein
VESLRSRTDILCESRKPAKPDIYFIGIGVSDYVDPALKLSYAAKDIRDLVSLFKQKYPEIIVDTLLDRRVTRENVLNLKQKLYTPGVDDKVILSISGHGFLSKDLDFYYGTSDIDVAHPEILGLSYDDIEWLLDSIPARNKLLMMDACHSGEVDREVKKTFTAVELTDNIIVKNKKGIGVLVDSTSIGLQNSFELMQELFSSLSKGNGAVAISAAGGLEYAYEGTDWKNGVFTYCVRKGLQFNEADENQDHTISVKELQDYLYNEVSKLTKGRQKPTTRSESIENDWVIW